MFSPYMIELRKEELLLFHVYRLTKNFVSALWNLNDTLWITILSANAAKELLVPYFPPVIESLKGFLTATTEEMRSLQTQSLGR